MKLASLSGEQLAKVQALESSMDATVLAYEPVGHIADLAEADLQALRAVEDETGLILLAVTVR